MPQTAPADALDALPAAPRQSFWRLALLPPLLLLPFVLLLSVGERNSLLLAIQALTQQLPDSFWAAVTLLGNGAMLFACLSLAWRQRPDWLMAGLCALPLAALISRGFKLGLAFPRPAAIIPAEQLHIIGERLLNHSFPSGHTLTAFVALGIVATAGRLPRAALIGAITLACLVGLSRIAVGAHWPADVVGGAIGGWLSGACGVALARRWAWTRSRQAEIIVALILLAASLGLFFVHIGYAQAILFKYLIAALGAVSALRWLLARWRT